MEDLPSAEQGYDRERVREAFDSFYRHIAQLDSTLRALEAVEVFRDQAGELRKELRALKAAGWTQQPWPTYSGGRRSSPGLPESLPRFAIEAAFLILVAVVVAVAGFDRLSIVLVMGLAWAIVGVVEWAASRERFARARVPVVPARQRAEPAQLPPLRIVPAGSAAAQPAEAWAAAAPVEAGDEQQQEEEERTVVRQAEEQEPAAQAGGPPAPAEAIVAPVDVERDLGAELEPLPVPSVDEEPADEAEPDPDEAEPAGDEPELEPAASTWSWAADVAVERARERDRADHPPEARRRFWHRRTREADGYRFDPAQPRHVRVLPPEPSFDEQFPVDESSARIDPWEQELDLSIEEPEGSVDPDPGPEREPEPAFDRGESG